MSLPLLLARRLGARLALPQTRAISSTAPNHAGYWNKDWRPADDPPATEEGKRAAAKKYGLIPEDYEPYPNDGTGYGDYPKLPLISAESRDPHALYDFPEHKRNFGEPMHIDADMVGEDRRDYNKRFVVPMPVMIAMFLGTVFGGGFLFYLGQFVRVVPTPAMPKPLVTDGRTYYSFELEDVK